MITVFVTIDGDTMTVTGRNWDEVNSRIRELRGVDESIQHRIADKNCNNILNREDYE